jgi:hypothetical protein
VISKLGAAAIKGNFELTRAHMLYDDLHQAQKSLVLLNELHLLYLVTPYEIAEQIKPNKNDYYNIVRMNFVLINSINLDRFSVLQAGTRRTADGAYFGTERLRRHKVPHKSNNQSNFFNRYVRHLHVFFFIDRARACFKQIFCNTDIARLVE